MEKNAPESSDPTEAEGPGTSGSAGPDTVEPPQVFGLNKVAYFTVPMALVVALVLAGASLVWFGWTLILPVVLAWWIHRIRTVVTEDGLRVVRTFSTVDIGWSEIDGLQFPRWTAVRAVLTDGSREKLPAITFRDLPRLSAASRGRIPDPYAGVDE